MNFFDQLKSYYKAKAKVIQVITYENLKLQGEIQRLAEENDVELLFWNRVEGSFRINEQEKEEEEEEISLQEVLENFISNNNTKKQILYLEGIQPELQGEANAIIKMLNLHSEAFTNQSEKTIIFSQTSYYLPEDLEKNVVTLETGLPNLEDIKVIFKKVKEDFNVDDSKIDENDLDKIFNAVLGLSTNEIFLAFNRAYLSNKRFTSSEVALLIKEKEKMIKKSGFLEYFHPKQSFKEIGGLENLKRWLEKRKEGFSKKAKDYGLTPPKGVLLLGIPGTGKSLAAKAVGSHWNMPLLKLDMGKIFGGIVGESEGNIRKALQLAETLSPSILWIDEIEKGLSGYSSSGATDGGTTSRVLGTFLTWMQEKENPVFVIATANDISQLPPELLRKGRFDEIFFVDLPSLKERKEIFKIHIEQRDRKAKNYDLELLSEKSRGFSGAEIEEVVNEAMYSSYYNEEDLQEEEIIEAIENTYPLSKTMEEIIKGLRKWAKKRAILASNEKSDYEIKAGENKEEFPKLKQEMKNPFYKG